METSNNTGNSPRTCEIIKERVLKAVNKAKPFLDIIIPLLILAIGVGAVLYYVLGPSKYYMTGDSTDSLRWAQASFESGKLISDNFAYAAILPVGGNLLFYPFIAIFGYSVAAQLAGLTCFVLIFAAALYYMATGVGLNRYASSALVSLTFLIMSSSAKLREIMWEHVFYYNLGLLFFCIGVGLVARILRYTPERGVDVKTSEGRGELLHWALFCVAALLAALASVAASQSVNAFLAVLCLVIAASAAYIAVIKLMGKNVKDAAHKLRFGVLALFTVLAATDGLQTLVCFSLPVIAGIFLNRFFDSETPFFSKKNICSFCVMGILLICSGAGYLLIDRFSGGINAGYADAYSSYSGMSSWTNNFLGFFKNWFSLIGVSVVEKQPLVSKESIVNIIRIFGALALLAIPFILLAFYKKIESRAVKIALWAHFGVSAFILFAVTFGRLGGANWRLTPMLGTSVLVAIVGAFELMRAKKEMAVRFGVMILCLITVLAVPSALDIKDMDKDNGDNAAWHIAAEELESRGLKYGYANFWFAQTITLLSDNEVQTANIYENYAQPYAYMYQINYDAFDDKEDADNGYFLLLTEEENDEMRSWLLSKDRSGAIIDEFTIETPGYDLRGHEGETFYVYVFEHNIFYTLPDGTIKTR